ncbi:MAG: serine/threonine protein kinase, partial [Rhodoferax sp.]
MPHAFETLTPDLVLDALESVGLRGDGRLTALSSYENRVYQVHLEDNTAVVAKFYRPKRWSDAQIQEEHDFAAELMAAEIPAIGPMVLDGHTLHHFDGFAFSVSPRRGGRAPELDDGEVLEWIGRFLARIHTVGAKKPFATRPHLNVETFGTEPMQWLLENDMVPLDVQSAWTRHCEDAIKMVASHAQSIGANGQNSAKSEGIRLLRLHGDCHPGNILWTPTDVAAAAGPGPHFVDLDDARMGPAVQDLWMLLSGDRQQRTRQLGMLID